MIAYPTAEQVERADITQLMGWCRYLPSPTDEQRPLMDRMLERLAEGRRASNAAYVAASKAAGHRWSE